MLLRSATCLHVLADQASRRSATNGTRDRLPATDPSASGQSSVARRLATSPRTSRPSSPRTPALTRPDLSPPTGCPESPSSTPTDTRSPCSPPRKRSDGLLRSHGAGSSMCGVLHQGTTSVPITTHNVQRTGRQELLSQLGQHGRRGRGGVGRLEHHRVTSRKGGRDLPHHHRQRVVPRGDLPDDTDRFPPDERRVIGQVLPRRPALQHPTGTREEPEMIHRGRHLLRRGQVQRLTGVATLRSDERLRPRLERIRDPQQRQRPLLRGRGPHVSNARSAAAYARSTSSAPDNGARAYTSPVLGSITA